MVVGGVGGGMNWEIGIDIYTLIRIKWITNKILLYKKINKILKFFLKSIKKKKKRLRRTMRITCIATIWTNFSHLIE